MRFLLTLLFPLSLFSQKTWYVNARAGGINNGSTWSDAFVDLQDALKVAQAGDAVWVAEGRYVPDEGSNRNRAFSPKSGVSLHGGFAGTEKTLLERGDPSRRETVLSGNIGNIVRQRAIMGSVARVFYFTN